ncbi:MAG TPA: ABC transporter permease subunit, partial [Lachnospiraceae bacterium]|nr:ABC transporter permease subunit [Lachnospiraceae bacterium]
KAEGDISELHGDYLRIPSLIIGNPSTISEAVSYYSEQLHFYRQLKKEHAQILDVHEMKGFNFLYLAFKELFPMVALLIVMLILADCMSSERDSGSYKFLLLQPISRGKVLMGKAIAAVITSLAAILLPFLLSFLLIGVVNGFGSSKYQVLMSKDTYTSTTSLKGDIEYTRAIAHMGDFYSNLNNETDNAYRLFDYRKGGLYLGVSEYASHSGFEWYDVPNSNIFEPVKMNLFYSYSYEIPNKVVQMINEPFFKLVGIKDFLIQLLPVVILYLVFGAFLALFISTMTQHSTISIVLCILFGGGGSVLLRKISGSIGRYIPFSFGDCVDILKGVSEYTMKQGVQTLTVTSLLLFILSYLSFRKRDIIC